MMIIQMIKRPSSKHLGFKESTDRGDDDYFDNNSTSEIGCSASSKCSIDASNRKDRVVDTSHVPSLQSWNEVGRAHQPQRQQFGMTSSSRIADAGILARNEERRVRYSKCVMLGVLILTCAVLATGVFYVLRAEEENEFHTQVSALRSQL